jgi:3-oxoacyl-[acyl-carrier protein] reductase
MKVLVTGGSSEISRSIINRRIKLGDEVFFTATTEESLAETQTLFLGKAQGLVFDFAAPTRNEAVFTAASGFDAVVLSAFTKQRALKPFQDFTFEEFQIFLRNNIEGNAWLIHRLFPGMIERKFGRLVFISSLSAASGTSRYPAYCTAKAALEGLFLNLAVDGSEHGVFSNIIRPGLIATKRNEKLWKRTGYDEIMKEVIPSKTIGKPVHVAQAVDLALERDSYLTGAIIPVGGGLPFVRTSALLSK